MTKRMLIDGSHAEETRVVVLDGNRLEDFDVETSTKRQLKGNIYLAKVVRVEPSLQAAFVEYGGNRHGFLAFSEIHPDYYQIPVADRQRLLEMQAEEARREEEEEDLEIALIQATDPHSETHPATAASRGETLAPAGSESSVPEGTGPESWALPGLPLLTRSEAWASPAMPLLIRPNAVSAPVELVEPPPTAAEAPDRPAALATMEDWASPNTPPLLRSAVEQMASAEAASEDDGEDGDYDQDQDDDQDQDGDTIETLPPPETVGGGDHDGSEESRERRMPPRFMRNYKIQEVIRRRQILLVQVVKEERGTKGAALTTYLSLAGRFGVLMPNSPRGGGISRKITSAADRRRLKEVMAELDIPRGMGLIVRTAGANRPKPEIKRDCEYLLRLWDDIREHTMKSVAPALIYEEASLIKRAIRDVYSRDIDEILVDGEDGWRSAHEFMRMLVPAHARKVQLWRDGGQPLFARYQVESQLDAMLMPTVQLRSGGYLVINQTEALVAIDVNSGRSTRERNIEETALRTNLEAADEVARQLRLRDLAGLIVIDFIDMESKRHNAMVERRVKEALKNDRARIQVGHISHFGLLEMSRQRLRPSLAETSFIPCPHCGGTGHVRSTESAAIHVLRGIEDEGGKRRSAEIVVHVSTPIALYLLNHKRERLREIELRYAMRVIVAADDAQIAPQFRIEKVRVRGLDEAPPVVTPDRMLSPMPEPEDEAEDEEDVEVSASEEDEGDSDEDSDDSGAEANGAASADDADRRRKRRRRRRRGGRRDESPQDEAASGVPMEAAPDGDEQTEPSVEHTGEPADEAAETNPEEAVAAAEPESGERTAEPAAADEDGRGRRRGRRGGRRRRRDDGELSPYAEPGAEQPDLTPVYAGPTPADPFGGRVYDIFDVMDQVEQAQTAAPVARAAEASEEQSAEAPQAESEIVNAGIVEAEPEPAPVAVLVQTDAAAPASVAAEAVLSQADILNTGGAEVAGETAVAAPSEEPGPVAAPEPETTTAEPPAPPEPLVKPILIGTADEPPAAKKRGWWRR
ncbi:MAG TPA: Rne/Rng family ribonuclease [Rhodopila sp.]|nr:Rne/Rng family ribonuclease [Rhodopila sp.]